MHNQVNKKDYTKALYCWPFVPKSTIELWTYRQTSDIKRTLIANKIVDHSDVVGASPVGAVQTISSFSTWYLVLMNWAEITNRRHENHLSLGIWCAYISDFTVLYE